MKTKVLLMDLDVMNRRKPFPNLALMKLSAFHKARGDEVYLNFPLCRPDITYASCVFTWNGKKAIGLPSDAVIGGSGLDLSTELPPEIEKMRPDYSLYPNVDFGLGFTSRGCIRNCPWCLVPQKEGEIKAWSRVYDFWFPGQREIILLDNNILAAPNWKETLTDLAKLGVRVDFNQGLDIRLINEEVVGYLKRIKTRHLRFSFDAISYENEVRQGIELLINAGIRSRKLLFYVLVGFGEDETAIERMKLLQAYNVDVFPMLYKGKNGKEPARKILEVGDIPFFHGTRRNINKFLRVVGRLPN